MSELRDDIAAIIAIDPLYSGQHDAMPVPEFREKCLRIADAVLGAIEASGRVVIDRARLERLLRVAIAAHEELSEEAGYGGSGTTGTCAAVEWLQPGDLEPLG